MRSTRKIFQSVTVCGRILPIVTSSSAESTRLHLKYPFAYNSILDHQECQLCNVYAIFHKSLAWASYFPKIPSLDNIMYRRSRFVDNSLYLIIELSPKNHIPHYYHFGLVTKLDIGRKVITDSVYTRRDEV